MGQVFHVDLIEQLEANGLAGALRAGLHAGIAIGHGGDPDERANLLIGDEHTIGVGDEDVLAAVAVTSAHLHDGCTCTAGRVVHPQQQCHLVGLAHIVGVLAHRADHTLRATGERHRASAATALAGGRCGRLGRRPQAGLAEIGGVRETGGVALHHTDSGTVVVATGDLLDAARPSRPTEVERLSSANTSAKSAPVRTAAASTRSNTSWSITSASLPTPVVIACARRHGRSVRDRERVAGTVGRPQRPGRSMVVGDADTAAAMGSGSLAVLATPRTPRAV